MVGMNYGKEDVVALLQFTLKTVLEYYILRALQWIKNIFGMTPLGWKWPKYQVMMFSIGDC